MFDPGRGFITPDQLTPEEAEVLLTSDKVKVTSIFHAVWHAIGKPHICIAVPQVEAIMMRNDDGQSGTLGIVYLVRSDIWPSPETLAPEDHEAMITATSSFLKGMGAEVRRDEENSTMLHVRFNDGPQIDVIATPFNSEVDKFVADMEKALGPSAEKPDDPNDPMSRWM